MYVCVLRATQTLSAQLLYTKNALSILLSQHSINNVKTKKTHHTICTLSKDMTLVTI